MKLIILGATSTIAREISRRMTGRTDEVLLAARDAAEGETLAADLRIRTGAAVQFRAFDATAPDTLSNWMAQAIETLGGLDGVVLCFGYLGSTATAAREWTEARRIAEVNYTAAVALLEPAAAHLEAKGAGFLLALSSVAGVRGRRSNYHYGAAKGALTLFLEGLGHRLAPSGVRVKIALLGFVESPMSAGVPMSERLRATPEQAAEGVIRLLRSNRQAAYIPWFWGPIMTVIRLLPAGIFNRTKL